GRVEAGAEAAAGQFSGDASASVGDFGAFARRSAAFGTDADPPGRRAVDGVAHDLLRARKILGFLAALADGPHQAGFCRVAGLVDVMAVEAKPRLQPEAVARAQSDGQHFAFTQEGASHPLGIGAFQRYLETILAGIAGAADDGGPPPPAGGRPPRLR